MMVRSRVYHNLGGLDEDFFAHMEEIDLCWRIQRSGGKVYYQGNSTVYHVGGGTLSKSNPRKTYYNFRNGLVLLLKNLSTSSIFIKLPVRVLLDYIACFKFIIGGNLQNGLAILKAHRDIIKNLTTIRGKRKALLKFPFTNRNIYKGFILWQYFVMGKKKVEI
jgi:GT2 family glycosyltransferase